MSTQEILYHERGYRRGYYRGFVEALTTLHTLHQSGLAFEEAFEKCVEFAQKDLDSWQHQDPKSLTPPPQLR